jgi:hypothetical protein
LVNQAFKIAYFCFKKIYKPKTQG